MFKKYPFVKLSIRKVLLRSLILAIVSTFFLTSFLVFNRYWFLYKQTWENRNPFSHIPYSLQTLFYLTNLQIEKFYFTFLTDRTDTNSFVDNQMTTDELYLSILIRSSVSAISQIFYDTGKGIDETDSVRLVIEKGTDFQNLRFPLPKKSIRYIRFDPSDRTGHFSLKDIKIVNKVNQVIYRVNLEAIHPLRQIKQMSIRDDILSIETIPNANDPILFIDIGSTLDYKSAIFTSLFYWCISFSNIVFLLWGGTFLYSRLIRLIKQISAPLVRKDRIINVSILVIFSSLSIVIGYYIYLYVKPSSQSPVYRGHDNDYSLSFYNRQGKRITEQDGVLKLVTDPFTIYANYPNQQSKSYSINTHGFREGYVARETSAKLAIVLGGSAAFGQGLDDDNKTFSSLLSRYNQNYHVINAGVVGFLSGQELAQMVHYLDDFHPSLYIVFDGWNDIFDPYTYAQNWPISGGPIGFNNTFLLIESRLFMYVQTQSKEKKQIQLSSVEKSLNEVEYFQKIRTTYLSNISKMNSFANAREAKFLMVFQPELGNKKSKTIEEQEMLKMWNITNQYLDKNIPSKYGELLSEAKKFCKEQNIAFIDINTEPEFSENPQTLFYDVVHPNELGHEIIAKIINNTL